ncbi:hypothetical protein BC332_25629 [Capsicum chinense]|nr:hypothetical protein BC332_25629 [Capsicum chinense]
MLVAARSSAWIVTYLLKESRFSGHVYWVTALQDFSITKLQNDIDKALDLDLSTEGDDDKKRVSKLYQNFKRMKSFVLILDDVWTNFDVNKVGIPLEIGGAIIGSGILDYRSVSFIFVYTLKTSKLRVKLILLFIVEELLAKRNNRGAEFDQGHALLNKLERACLLQSVVNYCGKICMRKHNLVREMALQIGRDEFKWMVKTRAQLVKIPADQEWSEDVDKVTLMVNDITKITLGLSYICSKLTTLSLLRNSGLWIVANSFFMQRPSLRVLDLRYTVIQQLPGSVSNLENLSTLLLQFCDKLRFVPPLNKIKNLIELDLYGTIFNEVPQGLESLRDAELSRRVTEFDNWETEGWRDAEPSRFPFFCDLELWRDAEEIVLRHWKRDVP